MRCSAASPLRRFLGLFCFCGLAIGQVQDLAAPKNLTAELLSENTAVAPGKPFRVAVKLVAAPGWHTYGKKISPNRAGKPTELQWGLPDGWTVRELPWPELREVNTVEGMALVYEGTVLLPALITPPDKLTPGTKARVSVSVDALVCKEVCERARDLNGEIELSIAAEPVPDAKNAGLFKGLPAKPTAAAAVSGAPRDGGIAYYLLLALLGGMILNIMPCVFPVLAIKITSVVSQAHDDKRKLMMHGLAYTLGVLVSLWMLAAVLLALRAAGGQFGWGFQLQSPWFVYGIVLIMLIFGLNMGGLFEVGTSAAGAGGELAQKSGVAGSFFSGLFATVVATPCTAPLLANALPVALSLPAMGSLAFFTVIGLGLASPYLVLSLMPGLLKKLPRPGPWMESFKQAMAFLMLGAAGFFAWVLMGLTSEENQRDLLIGMAIIAMAFWIYGRWCTIVKPAPTRVRGGVAALLMLALGVWWSHPRGEGLEWEKWRPQVVKALRDDGKPVYVDFTARWCATCQVNHRVYDDPAVRDEIKRRGIILLKADWTKPNPDIARTLHQEFNTEAVPLNVLYVPGREKPVILPNLLTSANVRAAFAELDRKE